jgi:hypothetical protein
MATSERRIAANRQNALLAKGPVTPGGKASSRRNSLKHGLTGAGVVVPAEEEAEVATRTARWVERFEPKDEYELGLIDRTVRAGVRRDRAAAMEAARRVEAAARARSSWAEDRRLAAEELAAGLAKRPSLVARKLRRTLQGCELLIERWRGLLRVAEAGTPWDEGQRARALDLLGVPPEDREHHPRVHARATAEELAAVAREELEHLEARRDGYLEDEDESERLLAETGLAFDDSPTGRRLWGYERANERIYCRGLDELERRRRGRGAVAAGPRPRPEPKPDPAGLLSELSAAAQEPVGKEDGTRSVPATEEADIARLMTAAVAVAPATRPSPPASVSAPVSGNRRARRAQLALARRRG